MCRGRRRQSRSRTLLTTRSIALSEAAVVSTAEPESDLIGGVQPEAKHISPASKEESATVERLPIFEPIQAGRSSRARSYITTMARALSSSLSSSLLVAHLGTFILFALERIFFAWSS